MYVVRSGRSNHVHTEATGICGPAYWRNEEKTDEINNEDDNEVKIIYNDVSFDENMDNTNKESIDNKETSIDEDNILSETKEQDLFNLIDDMYSSDDEDEEDDE